MSVFSPFPLPNERLHEGIVVASTYVTDEVAILLILRPEEPYFRVLHVKLDEGPTYPIIWAMASENIVLAVHEYGEQGGA